MIQMNHSNPTYTLMDGLLKCGRNKAYLCTYELSLTCVTFKRFSFFKIAISSTKGENTLHFKVVITLP